MRALIVCLCLCAPASARCWFEVYSPLSTRLFRVDLAFGGQEFHFLQPFAVTHDAEIRIRQADTLGIGVAIHPQAFLPREPVTWGEVVVSSAFNPALSGGLDKELFGFDLNIAGEVYQVEMPLYNFDPLPAVQVQGGWEVVSTGPNIRLGPQAFIAGGWEEATVSLISDDCLCYGDLDADGGVDQADMDLVLLNWGSRTLPDEWAHHRPSMVGQAALNTVLLAWGDRSPAKLGVGAVPEPSTIAIVLIVLVGLHWIPRAI